ncbi:MAG: hypothetical protein D6796_14785 [Caldilineae bacterium]|nr:MAG: hypothetical protein D6796_14785 [Caldilineae bacterium]
MEIIPRLELNTLGGLQILREGTLLTGFESRKARAMLIYLALEPRPHPRAALAGLLWSDFPEPRARGNLRRVLCNLRHLLAPHLIITPQTIAFDTQSNYWFDVEEFMRLPPPQAVSLYQGDFMAGFSVSDAPLFEEWMLGWQERLRLEMLNMLHKLVSQHRSRGEYEIAIAYAHRLLVLDPWREEIHRDLMGMLALTGQRSAALAQYEKCRQLLEQELGLTPLEETTALYRRLVNGEIGNIREEARRGVCLPFLGREEEHTALVAQWEQAQQGQGGLTLVSGEAGVGKTRLVEEVMHYAETQGAMVLRGRCYEFGDSVPYHPIAEALRSVLNREAKGPTGKETVVPFSLRAPPLLAPGWLTELSRLLPELRQSDAHLSAPVQASDETARSRLFEAVARFLLAIGHPPSTAPPPPSIPCLFLDDLHWAERSTLDLLHYLVRRLQKRPVWIVGTYRPEEVFLRHPLTRLRQGLGRDHLVTLLPLAPLPAGVVEQAARSLVGEEQGSDLGDFLYRESEGNPFILVETVNNLWEERALYRTEEARWQWVGPPTGEMLPPGVQDVILQRVGRLSDVARRLLTLAAVVGRQFDLPLLRAAAGSNAGDLEHSLHEWLERRLVRPLHPGFDFGHDKIRATLYHTLKPGQRRLLHRQIGAALEQLYAQQPEKVCEQLAYHYEQAEAAGPALTYLLLAGDKAATVYAHREALDFYSRALPLANEEQQKRNILLRQGRSLRFLARYEQAEKCWRQVIAGGEGDLLSIQAANELGRLYIVRCDYDQARYWSKQAHRWATRLGSRAEATRAWQTEGRVERQRGNLSRARRLFQNALAVYRAAGDKPGEAACLMELGNVALRGGRWERARLWFEQALTLYRILEDPQKQARCLEAYGLAHWRQGNNEAARPALEESLALYRTIGDREGEAASLNDLGLVHIVQDNVAETQQCWEQSIALYRSLGLEKKAASGLHNLAILHMDQGHFTQAQHNLEESLTLNLTAGDRLSEALDRGWLGKLCLMQGKYEEAWEQLKKAVALDEENGGSEEERWHHAWLGWAAYERGDWPAAQTILKTALRLIRGRKADLQAAEVYEWLAAVHLAQGHGPAALKAAQQFKQVTKTLGQTTGLDKGHILLATIYGSGLVGETEDPLPYFERALSRLSEATPYAQGLALRRYGAYLLRSGARQQGKACLRRAQTLFEQLGARGELDKVRRLLRGDEPPPLRW